MFVLKIDRQFKKNLNIFRLSGLKTYHSNRLETSQLLLQILI